MRLLITAGGTEEPIDGVRTITNFSTGRTGAIIADVFHKEGFDVTLLTSLRGVTPKRDINIIRYQSFKDLNTALSHYLKDGSFCAVIHAAAVSDYSVDYLESEGRRFPAQPETKLNSTKPLTITLKPNIKLIDKIKEYAPLPLTLIGFKLTKNANSDVINRKVKSLFSTNIVDYVVQNDLTSIDSHRHVSTIYSKDHKLKRCNTKEELAMSLVEIIRGEQL